MTYVTIRFYWKKQVSIQPASSALSTLLTTFTNYETLFRIGYTVKTPVGATEMFELEKIVLQGSVFGPIKCSVQMDTIGREALRSGFGVLKYKSTIDVPSLAMIYDVMGMSPCGDESIQLNAIINSKMEIKKLRLSEDKCF